MTEDNRVQVGARIPPTLRNQVQTYADHHNITLSRAVENLLRRALTTDTTNPQ